MHKIEENEKRKEYKGKKVVSTFLLPAHFYSLYLQPIENIRVSFPLIVKPRNTERESEKLQRPETTKRQTYNTIYKHTSPESDVCICTKECKGKCRHESSRVIRYIITVPLHVPLQNKLCWEFEAGEFSASFRKYGNSVPRYYALCISRYPTCMYMHVVQKAGGGQKSGYKRNRKEQKKREVIKKDKTLYFEIHKKRERERGRES